MTSFFKLERQIEIYNVNKERDFQQILNRRKKIESYKENTEQIKQEKIMQAQEQANKREEKRRKEEYSKLQEENKENEKRRKLAEQVGSNWIFIIIFLTQIIFTH